MLFLDIRIQTQKKQIYAEKHDGPIECSKFLLTLSALLKPRLWADADAAFPLCTWVQNLRLGVQVRRRPAASGRRGPPVESCSTSTISRLAVVFLTFLHVIFRGLSCFWELTVNPQWKSVQLESSRLLCEKFLGFFSWVLWISLHFTSPGGLHFF